LEQLQVKIGTMKQIILFALTILLGFCSVANYISFDNDTKQVQFK